MGEIVKETTVKGPVKVKANSYQTTEYLIYFFFGALEILLAFLLILKLAGAGFSSFVNIIYGLTGIFILPFEGIFRRGFAQGAETALVFEPSTLVAIIAYIALAFGIVKLVRILSGQEQEE